MRVLLLAFYVLFLLLENPAAAQNIHYTITHYTDENGLPQNSVKSIFQGPSGFVWFTTESGLIRFDGRQFRIFDRSNTRLQSSRFSEIQPDYHGKPEKYLAISENNQTLSIDNGRVSVGPAHPGKMPVQGGFSTPRDILYTGLPNYVWKQTLADAGKFVMISKNSGRVSFVCEKDQVAFYGPGGPIGRLHLAGYGYDQLFTLNDQLYQVRKDKQIWHLTLRGAHLVNLSGDILRNQKYRRGSRRFTVFSNHLSDQSFLLCNGSLYKVSATENGHFTTTLLLEGFNFEVNHILRIFYQEKTGRIFLGSPSKGLFVLSPKRFTAVSINPGTRDNITYAHIRSGRDLAMVVNGKLFKAPADTTNFHKAVRTLGSKKDYKLDEITLALDLSGRIWCSSGYQLDVFDPSGTRKLASIPSADWIYTMRQGEDGRLWVGTKKSGIWYVDTNEKTFNLRPFVTSGFVKITNVLPSGNALLVGTDQGLYTLDVKSRRATLIAGTKNLTIRDLHISDTDGQPVLFFSTYGGGIFLCENDRLTRLPPDARNSLLFAHCFVEDGYGYLWISTNSGLIQARKSDLISYAKSHGGRSRPFYLHYGRRHGFQSNEFNGGCVPCAVTLPDSAISFPSMEGLVRFKPATIVPELPESDIFIDEVSTLGGPVGIRDGVVSLPANPRQVTIQLSTPYFGDPINLTMAYAISADGSNPPDSAWIDVGPDNRITFSELPSGKQWLHIKKATGFGPESFCTKTLLLDVPLQWHQTGWFYASCVVLAILAGNLFSKARAEYFRRENMNLEKQIMLRTSNLMNTMSALQRSEEKLNRQAYIQTRLIASISHDIRNPLRYLSMLISTIERSAQTGNTDRITEICGDLRVSSERMAGILDNHLEYARSLIHNKHEVERTVLSAIVQEKTELFLPYLKQRGNRLIDQVPPGLAVHSDPDLLKVIVHNLIDNANKYTTDGKIRVFAEQRHDSVLLSFLDDGQGFPADILDWLNDSAVADLDMQIAQHKKEYNGLGLVIIKDLCHMLGIRLTAANTGGARIVLHFTQPTND